jgi:hypothetical protein
MRGFHPFCVIALVAVLSAACGDRVVTCPDDAVAAPWPDGDEDGFPGEADCDDAAFDVNPAAPERCDAVDNDCDREVDESDAIDAVAWFLDVDGDGFGGPDTVTACAQPAGTSAVPGDCDDAEPSVFPGAVDVPGDGLDQDCDGADGTGDPCDADEDGFVAVDCGGDDCDDSDPAVNPAASEVCGGVDDDCDGLVDEDAVDALPWYLDADGDGFGDPGVVTLSCDPVSGSVDNGDDCDDSVGASYPGAPEACDGLDNDCDGVVDDGAVDAVTWYADADGDGFGDPGAGVDACAAPAGTVANADDCDDADVGVYPGAPESCDGFDEDCDGLVDEDALDASVWYVDADGDGYGDPDAAFDACGSPPGSAATGTDCDDGDASIFPGAAETCNGLDDDCDGLTDEDAAPWTADLIALPSVTEADRIDLLGQAGPSSFDPVVTVGDNLGEVTPGIVVGDFDADSQLDLVHFAPASATLITSYAGCDVWETASTTDAFIPLGVGDLDDDGRLDFYGWPDVGDPGGVALGDGAGAFTVLTSAFDAATPYSGFSMSLAAHSGDVNGDGPHDLAAVSYDSAAATTSEVWFYLGLGDGTFDPPELVVAAVPTAVNGVDIGDVDGDGYADIVLGADDDGDAGQLWWVAGGSGSWDVAELLDVNPGDESGTNNPGTAVPLLFDWDNDGWLDLLTVEEGDPLDAASKTLQLRMATGAAAYAAPIEILGEGEVSSYLFAVPAR